MKSKTLCKCPAVLQRRGPRLQYDDRAVSFQHRRRDGPLQGTRIFPGERRRRARSTEGQLWNYRRLAANGNSQEKRIKKNVPRCAASLAIWRGAARRDSIYVRGARGGARTQNPEIFSGDFRSARLRVKRHGNNRSEFHRVLARPVPLDSRRICDAAGIQLLAVREVRRRNRRRRATTQGGNLARPALSEMENLRR